MFCDFTGRLVLTTIAVTLMLTRPLMTISSNGSKLAIMPSCTADLLYNESITLEQIARASFTEFKKGGIKLNPGAAHQ